MTAVKAKTPFRWLRALLLVAGLAVVAAVVVMLLAYRFGRAGQGRIGTDELEDPGQDLTRGEGFDYTQSSEGRPVFRIRAARSRRDRENRSHLEEVEITVYGEGDERFRVTGRRAVYDQDSRDAELEGEVQLSGWGDLELEARVLHLGHQGRLLTSTGEVRVRRRPDLVGRASGLRVDFRDDSMALTGGVHLRTVPEAPVALALTCERLHLQRAEGVVRALGDVEIHRGDSMVAAQAVTGFLRDDRRSFESLRARWDVRGHLASPNALGEPLDIGYRSETLSLLFEAASDSPRRIELDGGAGKEEDAVLTIADVSGSVRALRGRNLDVDLEAGAPRTITGLGRPLELVERLDLPEPFLLRRVCAWRGEVRFGDDGRLARVVLEDQVDVQDRSLQLSGGDRARFDGARGVFDVQGREVRLVRDRVEVLAPAFSYQQDPGVVRATDGVRAVLDGAAIAGLDRTPLARGEGPLQVEAQEAVWTLAPAVFSFRGGVRAWRGQNLLLAEQLRGEEALHELAASDRVKTVWVPEAPGDTAPVEITAERLAYRQPDGRLVYDGDVRLRQSKRTVGCKELAVELAAASGAARRMVCVGDVKIDDPEARRHVTGESAVYSLAERRIEVFGQPVELRDATGNRFEGRYLVYDLAAGTAQLKGEAPSGAQAPALPAR